MDSMIQYANTVANITTLRDQSKSILEIGSRDGHDAEKLRKIFKIDPQKVFIVEANPDQAIKIKASYPNATTFDFAISNQPGVVNFNKVDESKGELAVGTSSLLDRPHFYGDSLNVIKVEAITAENLMSKIPLAEIDLCKIDVEGLTFEVLESFGESLHKIKTFHLECEHTEKWKNQKTYDVVKAFMEAKGYTQILFTYVWGSIIQSDSIWARNDICKGRDNLEKGYTGH